MEYRIEKDLLGEVKVPKDAYYGIHTVRACNNFPVSGLKSAAGAGSRKATASLRPLRRTWGAMRLRGWLSRLWQRRGC